jgi:mannose/fructose/N-acetylgalactosamine-specific phosphotransferase system component IIC
VSPPLLLTGLLGGWLAADATALAQVLVSQPLVGGALTGLAWGDLPAGLRVGALLQLFALAGLPLGGRTPHDYASAGVVGVAVAAALGRSVPAPLYATPALLGVAAGLAAALAGQPVIRWVRVRNEGLTRWAEAQVLAGRAGALDAAQWLGVGHAALVGAGFTLAALALGATAARWLLAYDGLAVQRAAVVAVPVLWGVGAGVAARQLLPAARGALVLFVAVLVFLLALRLAASG